MVGCCYGLNTQIGLHKDLGLAEEWSAEEIEILSQAVKLYGKKSR